MTESHVPEGRARTWLIVAGILLIGLAIRLAEMSRPWAFRDRDEGGYAGLVTSLADGDLRVLAHPIVPPGVTLPALALYPLTGGDALLAGRISSLAAGLALMVVLFVLVRREIGTAAGLVAAGLAATDRALVVNSTGFLTETHLSLWVMIAIAVLLRYPRSRRPLATVFLAGLLFGISYLCRPEGFLFGVVLVPVALVAAAPFERASWRNAVLLLFGFVVVATPYLVGVRVTTGRWQINARAVWHEVIGDQGYEQGLYGLTEDGSELRITAAVYDTEEFEKLPKRARSMRDVASVVAQNAKGLYMNLSKFLPPLYLLLMGAALAGFKMSVRGVRLLLAGLWLTMPVVLLILTHNIVSRHFVPLLPFAVCGVAPGVVLIGRAASGLPRVWRLVLHPVPITVLVGLVSLASVFTYNPNEEMGIRAAHIRMADWMRRNLDEDAVVMDRGVFTSALARRRVRLIPYASYERTVAYAARKGVSHLLLEEAWARERPQLEPLWRTNGNRDWEPLHEENVDGTRIVLFARRRR